MGAKYNPKTKEVEAKFKLNKKGQEMVESGNAFLICNIKLREINAKFTKRQDAAPVARRKNTGRRRSRLA